MSEFLSIENFFDELDEPYKNIEKASEPIVYQMKDSLVKWNQELPIPTQPGSIVKYKFMTTIGDISFGAKFFDRHNQHTPEVLTNIKFQHHIVFTYVYAYNRCS